MLVLRRVSLLAILLATASVRTASAQKLGTVELGAFAHYTAVQHDSLLGNSGGGGLRAGLFLFKYLEVETEYGLGTAKSTNIRYTNGKWYPERVLGVINLPVGSRLKLLLGGGTVDTWKGDITNNPMEEGFSVLAGARICVGDAWSIRPEVIYDMAPSAKEDLAGLASERSTRLGFRIGISRFFLRGSHTCRTGDESPKAARPMAAPPVVAAPPAVSPTATLSIAPASITAGQTARLTWSSTNATSCTSPWMNAGTASGSQVVSPPSSMTYTVTCTGSGGSTNATASITVSAAAPPVVRPPETPPPPPTPAAPPRELFQLMGANFDFDKSTLKPEGKARLDSAAKILAQFPTMRVEIQGHTDSVGTVEYNQGLSERRAKAALDYLVSKGVSSSRLVPRGYSKNMPIATNDTKEGRALNRRVMLIEIKN